MSNSKVLSDILSYTIRLIAYILKTVLTFLPKLIDKFYKAIEKRLRFSITFKTTTIYTLIFSSILLALSILVLSAFGIYFLNDAKNNLEKAGRAITILSDSALLSEDKIRAFAKAEEIIITVYNKQKKIQFTTTESNDLSDFYNNFDTPSFKRISNNNYLYRNLKVALNDDSYYLQLSKNLAYMGNYFNALLFILFIVFITTILITIIIGSRTIKKMLRPIYSMTKTVKSISVRALDTRIDVVDSKDELKDLAETFNEMLNRLQDSYELQNRFVSDASHELRTPIAVIQGYANLLSRWGKEDKAVLDESVLAIKSESENMKDLVEKLLFLARADKNTQSLEKEYFPFDELIKEIVKETSLITSELSVETLVNDAIILNADRKLIKQALRIFIDNSIKYTPAGGKLTINSSLSKNSQTISIEDTGIGISKEDLPFIFDRFYRCDKARTKQSGGTGLGLSIAKWIIWKHNGTIDVESALNKGTKIIITLTAK